MKLDCAGILLLLLSLFAACSIAGFDPADAAAGLVYPPNPVSKNWCGPVGATLSARLIEVFGAASVAVLAGGIVLAWAIFHRRKLSSTLWQMGGTALLTFALSALLHLFPTARLATPVGSGGLLGAVTAHLLSLQFSFIGSLLVLVPTLVVGLLLMFDEFLYSLIGYFRVLWKGVKRVAPKKLPDFSKFRKAKPVTLPALAAGTSPDEEEAEEASEEVEEEEQPKHSFKINRLNGDEAPLKLVDLPAPELPETPFQLPGLDLLDEIEINDDSDQEELIREQAAKLEETFAQFDMGVKVVQIDMGPVVTQFEIELEAGLRARKVMALSDDLAIAMRAPSVRIVAPIPGKNTVGIEVPNSKRAKVTLKEVIAKAVTQAGGMRLPVYLGKDVKGLPLVCDLASMPHLLIAGRTGTGKSVCLNALIVSILMGRTPDQVKLLMIDPKMVEMSQYKEIPHLMHPVVTDMKKAEALLGWAVDKMEERYSLLARVGVRHIDAYNKMSFEDRVEKAEEEEGEGEEFREQMPYILIIADELADLMMTSAKEVETYIIRLAQKSRAVGIHLVLATQKPTVDVITGLIKSNLPARIAFQVASRMDSRVVLDEMGADKLLGNGDMLFLYPGTSKLIRAQGTYVSDLEVERVCEFLSEQASPEFAPELLQLQTRDASSGPREDPSEKDDLYIQACDLVVKEQRGSVSLLQRGLGIGYGRAARLIDYMAEDGIVGPYSGSQAREVLYSMEQWDETRRERYEMAS
ncbi:MAG TPA: DNA translocase FtsK 4TM domain-containing protein [Planctomycetia bacterium]|nr:DNA translocase FtsK 4TM domain-containing protein [Planctomycetia bacterium]